MAITETTSAIGYRDKNGCEIDAYGFGEADRIAVAVAETTLGAKLPVGLYEITGTVDGFFKQSSSTPTGVSATDGHLFVAGIAKRLHIHEAGGEYIGAIRYDVDGFLYISRMK